MQFFPKTKLFETPKGAENPNNPHPSFFALHNHCSAFLNHVSSSLVNPTASALKASFDSAMESLGNQAKQALQIGISRSTSSSSSQSFPRRNPYWGWISHLDSARREPTHLFDLALSTEAIEERLAGVPVYALSNSAEEFVLVSGVRSKKSLGLFCFKEEDAEALLNQMKSMNPDMRQGSKVVAIALNKVFQLKVDGVSFRFIPDPSQIINAIKVKENMGDPVEGFYGVPIFQSRSLILKSQNKRYRPVFFRKEDLDESLLRASKLQNYLNPALRKGDIQVSVLEEIITAMKGSSASKWEDVVFIPPGLNVSVGLRQRGGRGGPIATA